MEALSSRQLRNVVLFFLLIEGSDSSNETLWTRDAAFDDKLSTDGYNLIARSKLHCGKTCSTNNTCVSFFFAPSQKMNCQLHNSIMTSSDGFPFVPASKYYLQNRAPGSSSTTTSFACHSNDGIFRTVKLEDGNDFTYTVIKLPVKHSIAKASCAALGGFLARVTTVARMDMLLQLTDCPAFTGPDYYVDGSNAAAPDPHSPDAWIMSNGEPVPMEKDFWCTTCPTKAGSEHCLRMRAATSYKWDDCSCSSAYNFICEK